MEERNLPDKPLHKSNSEKKKKFQVPLELIQASTANPKEIPSPKSGVGVLPEGQLYLPYVICLYRFLQSNYPASPLFSSHPQRVVRGLLGGRELPAQEKEPPLPSAAMLMLSSPTVPLWVLEH